MMCSLKKISLPGNQAAIVPAKYKTGRGSRTIERAPDICGNAQGNKNKSRRRWKRKCIFAQAFAFTAIITPRPQNWRGLHRFFERERYFHHARISGTIVAGLLSPVILYVGAFRRGFPRSQTV
jgi:hypothetical protein